MDQCVFSLNGEVVEAEQSKLHLSAAEYIRQHSYCKSVKVGCAEGGCGACAIELVQLDPAKGQYSVTAVNSCLLPVAALHGCHVLTSEGLGNSRSGYNEVHKRLAGFHATQCGFCSAGMSVAMHAALLSAAQKAQTSASDNATGTAQEHCPSHNHHSNSRCTKQCNGLKASCQKQLSSKADCTRISISSSSSSLKSPTASALLSALDGNLCRCTGWRPIADMAKSFDCDVDIEDLGLCSLSAQQLGPVTDQQQLLPTLLQQPMPKLSQSQQDQQQQQFDAALHQLRPGMVLVPTSLQQLLAAAAVAHAGGVPVHLIGGNTGAGIYPTQWQMIADAACIVVKHVPELHTVSTEQPTVQVSPAATGTAVDNTVQNASSSVQPPHLLAGAGVTISSLLDTLKDLEASEATAGRQQGAHNVSFLCSHISRIAGTLVRNAATLGGHLSLVRAQHLESDLVPIMTAAGAEVQLTATDGSSCWLLVEDFCNSIAHNTSTKPSSLIVTEALPGPALITAVRLPLPVDQPGSCISTSVWSYKLTTHRKCNEHAAANICCWLTGPAQDSRNSTSRASCSSGAEYELRIAVGTYQPSSSSSSAEPRWECIRARHVEAAVIAALQQQRDACSALTAVLARLPELMMQDVTPAGRTSDYVRSVAPGLLLKGLSVVLPQQLLQHTSVTNKPTELSTWATVLAELQAAAMSDIVPGPVPRSTQDLPINKDADTPLYWALPKDGSLLQASGEAEYTDDVPLAANALHAAYVTSSQAAAKLLEVDWTPALQVQGVVGFVGPRDVPAGPAAAVNPSIGATTGPGEPLFAYTTVQYVGQPLGLILATTQSAARAGAARVRVVYGQVQEELHDTAGSNGDVNANEASDGQQEAATDVSGAGVRPVTSLTAAIAANSWYDAQSNAMFAMQAAKGDVSAALAGSAQQLSGQLHIGSQRHFYMEPQTAVATPEEGGRIAVLSSNQGCDQVLWSLSRLLQLRHNQVHVSCRRVGGGFGGKADRAQWPAAAAAVAALKFRRQVRLVVATSVDASMNAGRCPMSVDWTAGLDQEGQLQALKLNVTCVAGAYYGSMVEFGTIASAADSVYNIPSFSVAVKVARCNLPPRTTVRGPGKVSGILMLEHILQQLAQATGCSPDIFRTSLMIQLPPEVLQAAAAAQRAASTTPAPQQEANPACYNAPAGAVDDSSELQQHNSKTVDNSDCDSNGSSTSAIPHPKYHPTGKALSTTFGKPIELCNYTLPYMWQQLQALSKYQQRRGAVDAFNSMHRLKKRGLAMVPIRYQLMHRTTCANVKVYADGSILISHAGTEMGQGIGTKVKQAAAAALGQLLPPSQRPGLLQYIRLATGSTELMPHAGVAAGSTTSESATVAVTEACQQLVDKLRPAAEKLYGIGGAKEGQGGGDVSWEGIVRAVAPFVPIVTSKVVLDATAIGSFNETMVPVTYHSFGVAVAEVEIDCVTGERQLLSAHLMFDAGRSVNPAVDLGQIEGAFMQGVGHVMTEEVVEDETTGATLTNNTWTYKPPGLAELPTEFHVHMLHDSPLHVPKLKQLSAKATGEPPLMMAAAVVCALQDAVAAAWADRKGSQQQENSGQNTIQLLPVLHLPATTVSIKAALPPVLYQC